MKKNKKMKKQDKKQSQIYLTFVMEAGESEGFHSAVTLLIKFLANEKEIIKNGYAAVCGAPSSDWSCSRACAGPRYAIRTGNQYGWGADARRFCLGESF